MFDNFQSKFCNFAKIFGNLLELFARNCPKFRKIKKNAFIGARDLSKFRRQINENRQFLKNFLNYERIFDFQKGI